MLSGLTPFQMAVTFLLPVVVSLALGGRTIRMLRDLKAGQRVRDDGPQRHLQKEGTPTMGGVLIVLALAVGAVVGSVLITGLVTRRMALVLGMTVAMGAVGFADDYLKIKRGRSLGLRARDKLAGQVIFALGFVFMLVRDRYVHGGMAPDSLFETLPAYLWYGLWMLAIVGTTNAVNLADGLDGLATGLCAIAAVGFAVLGALNGQAPVAVFALALAGACVGFLWFNRHPARMFMGDVGSLALGGALVGMAAVLDRPLALVGLCLVPFIEAASVVIQVISFKTTGKRVFKMSPIHHHFELSGWSEGRVVGTFWGVALAAAVVTVLVGVHGRL